MAIEIPKQQTSFPIWWPERPPVYDINKTYLENLNEGPYYNGTFPERPIPSYFNLLGCELASRLGVPAGPLLNARWIAFAARLGYDILTYKTIRSVETPAYTTPNIVYIRGEKQFTKADINGSVEMSSPPNNGDAIGITNSFGMPSMSRAYLEEDIPKALASIGRGQVLIVSVTGSSNTERSFLEDFVYVASFAKDCGAPLIEANFSCPNVDKKSGSLFTDPESIFRISSALVQAIAPIPLIIKVGIYTDPKILKACLYAAVKAGVRAICGINTLTMNVTKADKTAALPENRLKSGICGTPIRNLALDFIRDARDLIDREKLPIHLMGVGGITLPKDVDLFIQAGAELALTATGMMWDPLLAMRYHWKN